MPTPFDNWTTALRRDVDDAAAYLTAHPDGLNLFQASALAAGFFPRIERRLEQVRGFAAIVPEGEAALALLQKLRDGLWELLAPWCDPAASAEYERRLIEGDSDAGEPLGILAAPVPRFEPGNVHREHLRLAGQQALVRDFFGLRNSADQKPSRSHPGRHATPPGAQPREPWGSEPDAPDEEVA